MSPAEVYYHAGARRSGTVFWSAHTRRSVARAEAEARRLAHVRGGTPVVECWPASRGLRPGDCGVVTDAWEVTP